MSNRSNLLKEITNIREQCSDIESDTTSFEEQPYEHESIHIQSDSSESVENNEDSKTEDENENIINAPRKRMKMRILF